MSAELRFLWVRDPWLTLIESGTKPLEHRSRRTHHRGRLVLCSSQKADVLTPPRGESPVPTGLLGVTRCLVELVDCVAMTESRLGEAYPLAWLRSGREPEGFGWRVRLLEQLEPVKLVGMLGTPASEAVLAKNPQARGLAALIKRLTASPSV